MVRMEEMGSILHQKFPTPVIQKVEDSEFFRFLNHCIEKRLKEKIDYSLDAYNREEFNRLSTYLIALQRKEC